MKNQAKDSKGSQLDAEPCVLYENSINKDTEFLGYGIGNIACHSFLNKVLQQGLKRPFNFDCMYKLPKYLEYTQIEERASELMTPEYKQLIIEDKKSIFDLYHQLVGFKYKVGVFFGTSSRTMIVLLPVLLKWLIEWMEEREEAENPEDENLRGIFYAALITGLMVTNKLFFFIGRYFLLQMQAYAQAFAFVFNIKNSMNLPPGAQKHINVGTISTNMTEGSLYFKYQLYMHPNLLASPIVLTIYCILLVQSLSWVGLLAPLLLMLLTYIQNKIIAKETKVEMNFVAKRAKRVNLVQETINGIRIFKFNGWETHRIEEFDKLRKKEASDLLKLFMYNGGTDVISALIAPIIALVCFWVYTAVYEELSTAEIYSLLTIVAGLNYPMVNLVAALMLRRKAKEFSKNYGKLLKVEKQEVQEDSKDLEVGEVVVKDACFQWANEKVEAVYSSEKEVDKAGKTNKVAPEQEGLESDRKEIKGEAVTILKDINLHIKPGEFVGVVGKVGSGKSSLLRAICNEMLISEGSVKKHGSIALIPQEAFLMNETIKNNILFGKEFSEERYQEAVDLSQLGPDLDILDAGDSTQIGERGINLSGGQKQRISIARAMYSQSDLYLIDDALSALDAHVGHKVMEGAFKRQLGGKTRVMVTHQLNLLPEFDRVILVEHGKVVCNGSYEDVKDSAEFKQFYKNHGKEKEENKAEKEEEEQAIEAHQQNQERLEGGGDRLEGPSTRNHEEGALPTQDNNLEDLNEFIGQEEKKGSSQPIHKNSKKIQSKKISEEEKLKKGRITSNEQKSEGIVGISSYLYYAKRMGWFNVLIIAIFFTVYILYSYFLDYFISIWMKNSLNLSETGRYPFIYLGLLIVFAIILATRTVFFGKISSNCGYLLFKDVVTNILRRKMSFFDTTPIGQIITRTGEDASTVELKLPMSMLSSLSPIFMLIGICMLLVIISPLQAIYIFPFMILMCRSLVRSSKVTVELERMKRLASAPLVSTLSEVMNGVSSLRVYGNYGYIEEMLRRRCDANSAVILHEGMFYQMVVNNVEILGASLLVLTVWFVTLGKIYGFNLFNDDAAVGVALANIVRTTSILLSWIWTFNRVMNSMTSVERLKEYTEFKDHEAGWVNEEDSKLPSNWPTQGKIEIKNLKARYRKGLPLVINGLNVDIEARQKIGVVGRTGSGKSTLMLALMRILEMAEEGKKEGGHIKIDGADIYGLGLHKVRKALTIIPQDPFLLEGTLRSNLDPVDKHTTEELIEGLTTVEFFSTIKKEEFEALRKKLAKKSEKERKNRKIDMVDDDGDKDSKTPDLTEDELLQLPIEQSGSNLSLGQRQLICIARALVNKPKILLMDEATASVDQKTDEIIQRVIMEEMGETTILTIAHRINTIIGYDKILVMDKGRKAEEGSPRELLELGGIFSGMVDDCGGGLREMVLGE